MKKCALLLFVTSLLVFSSCQADSGAKQNPTINIYVDNTLVDSDNIGSFSLNEMPLFSYEVVEDVQSSYCFISGDINLDERVPSQTGTYTYQVTTIENDNFNSVTKYVNFSLYDDSCYISLVESKDMATLSVQNNIPLYVIKAKYTGTFRNNAFTIVDGSKIINAKDVKLDAANKIVELSFDISSLDLGTCYPHLYINGLPYDDVKGDVKNSSYSYFSFESDEFIELGNREYVIVEAYNMANILVRNTADEQDSCTLNEGKKVSLKTIDDNLYYVVNGTYTGNLKKADITIDLKPSISTTKNFDIFTANHHKWEGYLRVDNIQANTIHYPHIFYKGSSLTSNAKGDLLELCISNGETIISNGYRYTIYEDGYQSKQPVYGMACLLKSSVTSNAVTFKNDGYSLQIKDNKPYFTINGYFFGELTTGDLSLFDGNRTLPLEALEKNDTDRTFKAYFNISSVTSDFYAHLTYKGNPWGSPIGMTSSDIFINEGVTSLITPITINGKTYSLRRNYAMPVIVIN